MRSSCRRRWLLSSSTSCLLSYKRISDELLIKSSHDGSVAHTWTFLIFSSKEEVCFDTLASFGAMSSGEGRWSTSSCIFSISLVRVSIRSILVSSCFFFSKNSLFGLSSSPATSLISSSNCCRDVSPFLYL